MKKEFKKFNWIFFDLDGTLADSLPATYKAHLNFLTQFGIIDNKKGFEEVNGPSLPEIINILKTKYKLVGDKKYLLDLYRGAIIDAYRKIKPFNGVEAILKELKNRDYKLALVTSADQEIAMKFIKNQKLNKYFQNYVFGNEVRKAKPDPEIYNLAMKRISASPDSVVVIEDSYNGIKSAKATGVFVIGLANNQTKEDLLSAGADIITSNLKDILLTL